MLDRFMAVVDRARSILAADEGRLWDAPLYDVDWMGIESDRVHLTADPDITGYEQIAAGLWSGRLPDGIPVAGTPVEWAGRWWSAIPLPLWEDDDRYDAVRDLVHEAIHVKQMEQVLPFVGLSTQPGGPGTDLLETADGRTWLRLEVAALGRALTADGEDRRSAVADALLFRRRRLVSASAQEATRERDLDIAEGIPEYTAWRLTGKAPDRLAAHLRRLPEGSLVRSFSYYTGPAYGYLLDALVPGWRPALRDRPDLPALLAPAVADREPSDGAEARGADYDLDGVREQERRREAAGRERAARMRERFSGPVLRIRPGALRYSFDPFQVTPIEHGTVYRSFRWRSDDGSELTADEGLVTADHTEIWMPLDPAAAAGSPPPLAGDPLTGEGWTLRLGAAWELVAADRGWLARPAG